MMIKTRTSKVSDVAKFVRWEFTYLSTINANNLGICLKAEPIYICGLHKTVYMLATAVLFHALALYNTLSFQLALPKAVTEWNFVLAIKF